MPYVSVVMPVRNEREFITYSVGAVLGQQYPSDRLEIIVADGSSSDGTRDMLSAIAATDARVRVVDNPNGSTPAGLNQAIACASGDIIVRVDGRSIVAPDYIARCVEVLDATRCEAVGGRQNAVGTNLPSRAIALATTTWFGAGNARFRRARTPCWADTVYLGAYRAEVFRTIGAFDEELVRNQDDEFHLRLRQSGAMIRLDPSIRARYVCRRGFSGLWRQYYQYGLYKIRVMQKRRAVASLRQLAPAAFVVAGLASLLISLCFDWDHAVVAVLGPYAVATTAASIWAARRDARVVPLLPVAFAVLHVSYGLGFLAGMWRWRSHYFSNDNKVSVPGGGTADAG